MRISSSDFSESTPQIPSIVDAALVLVGAPNSGKTTLYNWLTASHFTTQNYPGSTVEYNRGLLADRYGVPRFEVIDSPGTYSLFPKSEDELVTHKLLFGPRQKINIAGVIVVVDVTQLSRQLLLVEQVHQTGLPMLVVLTMIDVLKKENIHFQSQLLSQKYQCQVVEFDGLLGGGINQLVAAQKLLLQRANYQPHQTDALPEWSVEEIERRSHQCEVLSTELLSLANSSNSDSIFTSQTLKWDRWLLHPFFGSIFFVVIMTTLFASVFWVASPMMEMIDGLFSWLASAVVELAPTSLWTQFFGNGLVASAGAVLVFVPQIFILFLGIGLLGDSGYLARAASLVDRPLSSLGLTGRSFVPLLSGFACAVPAIMATRNISSRRDRWITSFIIPLLTCSARLPVYALLIGFLFHGQSSLAAGFFLALLYIIAMTVGAAMAGLLNWIVPRGDKSFLLMELPKYRRPFVKTVLRQSFRRTQMYLKRAGLPIFVISTLIWVSSNFPNYQNEDIGERINSSYLGKAGRWIEPALEPMGVDWRVGVGLLSAFAAREVFVSTLAIVFHITTDSETDIQQSLLTKMHSATNRRGEKIFTTGTVLGLLAFFMVALQCMSTFAVSLRESGSWTMAISQLILFNLLAYGLAVSIVKLWTSQSL